MIVLIMKLYRQGPEYAYYLDRAFWKMLDIYGLAYGKVLWTQRLLYFYVNNMGFGLN